MSVCLSVCLSVCSRFSRPFRTRLGFPLPQSSVCSWECSKTIIFFKTVIFLTRYLFSFYISLRFLNKFEERSRLLTSIGQESVIGWHIVAFWELFRKFWFLFREFRHLNYLSFTFNWLNSIKYVQIYCD